MIIIANRINNKEFTFDFLLPADLIYGIKIDIFNSIKEFEIRRNNCDYIFKIIPLIVFSAKIIIFTYFR